MMRIYKEIILFFISCLFISNFCLADILFPDPTGKQFNDYAYALDKESLKNDINNRKKYLLAILYLNGNEEFEVKKDCSRAINILVSLSDDNIADADYRLSKMYYDGECVKKDFVKSRFFLENAAKLGFVLAERNIGSSYYGQEFDELYPDDINKAIYWFTLAANSGDMGSASVLSYIYKNGLKGVKVNAEEAFKWKLKAAKSTLYFDDVFVNFDDLAEFYEKGFGTDKDLVKAYKYYILSGNAGAKGKHRVVKEMTSEQIKEGRKLANEWMEKHHAHVFETY